jgi:serralysin
LGSNLENLTLAGTAAINGVGNALNNKIVGNSAANILNGGAGNDSLIGGAGNDTLTGGLDTDSLTGGAGNDTFIFISTAESDSGTNRDVITDFAPGDKISLSAIDANTLLSGNQSFIYSGLTTFTGVAEQLIYTNGILYGDTNGDGTADFQIQLSNKANLTPSSFIL